MPNLIKTAGNSILRLFSTIWSICTYPYRAIRSLLFIPIYPARIFFNPESVIYKYEIRYYFIMDAAEDSLAHIVNFDLQANMQIGEITEAQKQDSAKRYFEAAIFTKDFLNVYNPNKQFIIMADGNGTCYEQFDVPMRAMTDDDTNVIGFNPMGVGMSPGVTSGPDDYQAAIKAIIDNLHKNGVPHDHIVLQGRSLGAAMCLRVAEQYQARGERVKVIADRTFARLDNTAGTMLWMLYYPVKFLVRLLGLNVDAATAFNNINQINPGDAIGLSVNNDGIIPDSCDLYNGVSENMRQLGFIKKFSAHSSSSRAHNVPSEDIQEDEAAINNGRRRSGAEFMEEYRQIFKSQMKSASIIESSAPNEKDATNTLKSNSPTVTPFKDAKAARAKEARVHPEELQAPLLQRKARRSNSLSSE